MKLDGVKIATEIDLGSSDDSFVKVTVTVEDRVDGLPGQWEFSQKIAVDPDDFSNVENVIENHPLSLIKLCESPAEVWFYLCSYTQLPGLKPQLPIGPYRVDFALPDKNVVIEIDGHEYHKTQAQRTNDAKRERYLQLEGWRVIRFTGLEVYHDKFSCVAEATKLIAAFEKQNVRK